jgi:translation initiation factor 3 subunit L
MSITDIPGEVRSYIRKFQLALELGRTYELEELCNKQWTSLSEKYYGAGPWPSIEQAVTVGGGDETFGKLYGTLYYRHLLITIDAKRYQTPGFYIDAWHAFDAYFALLEDAREAKKYQLPAVWVYQTIDDALYMFQRFHDMRLNGWVVDGDMVLDEADEADVGEVWTIVLVLQRLHAIVEAAGMNPGRVGAVDDAPSGVGTGLPSSLSEQAGLFALVGLLRLHARLGDYILAMKLAQPVRRVPEGALSRVPKCAMAFSYYYALCCMMSRRFGEATRVLSRNLLHFHRTRHVLGDSGSGGSLKRRADKMFALLAICEAACPGQQLDSQVKRQLDQRHGGIIKRLAAGEVREDTFDELFISARPKFLDPAASSAGDMEDLQTRLLKLEVAQRTKVASGARSYLRLYTNIDFDKLASFTGSSKDTLPSQLCCLRAKQFQQTAAESGAVSWRHMDPLHFHVTGETVDAVESRVASRTTAAFARNINSFHSLRAGIAASAGGGKA